MTVRPLGASDLVELCNTGPDSADVGGWEIRGDKGTYAIPAPTTIPPGGYVVIDVGDILRERGGVTSLIDVVKDAGRLLPVGRDSVHYGDSGSAPLPPAGMSLARAPDASAGIPPAPDPALDGLVWTIDPTPTFEAVNDAPAPQMGSGARLNELDLGEPGGEDPFEIFNPGPAGVNLGNWTLINGDGIVFLAGMVPPGGFHVLTTPPFFDLEQEGLLYLFRPDGVRVDQLGFHDAPPSEPGLCLSRCPDGSPPFLGYSYATSGGDSEFLPLPCTLGESNCSASPVEPRPEDAGSWGRLKHRFR